MINDQLNPHRMEQQIQTERTGTANLGADALAQASVATFNPKCPSRTFGTNPMVGNGEDVLISFPAVSVKVGVVTDVAWHGFPYQPGTVFRAVTTNPGDNQAGGALDGQPQPDLITLIDFLFT